MPLWEHELKNAYVGDSSGWALEISYNLRGWTLAWLQSAWFDGIKVNWWYAFDTNWLYQTSESNDKGMKVYKKWLDLSNAKKITIRSLWYWYRGSWSNGKEIGLAYDYNPPSDDWPPTWPWWYFSICPNNNSAQYCEQWIYYYSDSAWSTSTKVDVRQITDIQSGDTTLEAIFNLETKSLTFTHSWANNNSFSATLSDAQVAEIKWSQAVYFWWWRWYHTYDAYERLKEVYLKIEI